MIRDCGSVRFTLRIIGWIGSGAALPATPARRRGLLLQPGHPGLRVADLDRPVDRLRAAATPDHPPLNRGLPASRLVVGELRLLFGAQPGQPGLSPLQPLRELPLPTPLGGPGRRHRRPGPGRLVGCLAGVQLSQRRPDPLRSGHRIGELPRQLVAARRPEQVILGGVHLGRLGENPRRSLPHPPLAPVGRQRRVRRDLRTVQRNRAEPAHPAGRAHQQHLAEQAGQRRLMLTPEPGNGRVIRTMLRTNNPKRHVRHTQPLDLPARPLTQRIGVDQQSQHHRRVIPGPPGTTKTPPRMKLAQIQLADHIQHKPHQMIRRQPIPQIRRQQKRLIPIDRQITPRHNPVSRAHPPTP
jgi:hypothetical protein